MDEFILIIYPIRLTTWILVFFIKDHKSKIDNVNILFGPTWINKLGHSHVHKFINYKTIRKNLTPKVPIKNWYTKLIIKG